MDALKEIPKSQIDAKNYNYFVSQETFDENRADINHPALTGIKVTIADCVPPGKVVRMKKMQPPELKIDNNIDIFKY